MASGGFILACIMAFLFIIYSLSSAAKYYIKFAIILGLSWIWATLPIPLMLMQPFDPRNALIPAWLLRQTMKLLGISWEVRGIKNVDYSRGSVVLMNHQSLLDLLVLAILWPKLRNATVVAKNSVFWIWPFGLAAWLWGTVFINRAKPGQSRSSINQQAEAINDRKAKLLLFPEGTRNDGNELLPFKKGAFHCSIQAKVPIQPVVISKYHFLDYEKRRFSKGHFVVSILPPIESTDYAMDSLEDLVAHTRATMQTAYADLSAESLLLNARINYDKIKSK